MGRLTREELANGLALMREIYAAPELDAFVRCLLDALPRLIPSDIVGYNEYNPSRRRVWYVAEPQNADPPGGPSLFSQFTHEHPLIIHYRKTRDGRALKISDFLSRAQYHRLGLYNEYFRRCKPSVEDLIAIHFGERGARFVAALALGRHGKNYTERERFFLDLIRPHLSQAYCNIDRVDQFRRELIVAQGALEALNEGVVVLDGKRRVRMANQRARKRLADYGAALARGRLPEELDSWVRKQHKLFDSEQGLSKPAQPLFLRRDDRTLVITMAHCPGADTTLLLDEQRSAPDLRELRAQGLTRRESEITSLLAQGSSNKEIARLLGIAPKTVEKHLQQVYAKFAVSTRTAAAARALTARS